MIQPTVVPNNVPTPAVTAIASEPQNATRTEPAMARAPLIRVLGISVRTHRHVFAGGHRPCTGHESCRTGEEDLMSRRRCRRDSDDKTRG